MEYKNINRTIYKEIEKSLKTKPVTLIAGARQVGKTYLCEIIEKKYKYNYVTMDNSRDREFAKKDPIGFLNKHEAPLIIDEIRKAEELFPAIEEVVNNEKRKNKENYGMYIITGSQIFNLMENITESLAGRVSIIHMPPLSRNELLERNEDLFSFDPFKIEERALKNPLHINDLFKQIVKGFYPEIYVNKDLTVDKMYQDYVETYLEKDVSKLINTKNLFTFRRFMELLASLTGEELVKDNIAKLIGIDIKTVESWLSILLRSDLIYFLEPYNEYSISKRIVKRPKIYFSDTGLACYLARLNDPETLALSRFGGRFVETFIINEIRKTYLNNGISPSFYYYRDNNQNEIDLIILEKGKIHKIECKSNVTYSLNDVKAFNCLDESNYVKGTSFIISTTDKSYPIGEDVYVVSLSGI